ncbi:uncharacterized protein KY384_006293 [Bacidia gigantensis]|uniref:uncharacterized protein n=1 Tax=Bacidia gigantensis TaxID=2732470 RepID=UPI001D050757|nr:uncharacterized protein KY384_006293 [Bacidia gigantensis]KAG8528606.1 hypothetical protein KY384_006293 [Bacidia gigantensis]
MATTQRPTSAVDPSLVSHKNAPSTVTVRSRTGDSDTDETGSAHETSYSEDQQILIVKQTMLTVQRKTMVDLEIQHSYFENTTIEEFLEFITHERLTRLPHRGSLWDRILRSAEYFGLQISAYGNAVGAFVPESHFAMGPQQGPALEPAFGVFHKLGLTLSITLRSQPLYHVNEHIRMELGSVFSGLLSLVAHVATYYRKQLSGMLPSYMLCVMLKTQKSGMSTTMVQFDFNSLFGKSITNILRTKDHIADTMWSYSLRKAKISTDIEIKTIRKWLLATDTTLQTLLSDRSASKTVRTEFTCEWIQRPLLDFFRTDDQTFAITGDVGTGKSVLAGWVQERLQRPLSRKSHETLSFTFEADIPSQCKSLSLIKSLAAQLLDRNVGNVEIYKKLAATYELSTKPGQDKKVEAALWEAVEASIKSIASKENNLVILVDGLDHIKGGTAVAKETFQKIHHVAMRLAYVRSIIFCRPECAVPSKYVEQLKITPDHVHDDIRRVVNASLEHHKLLQKLSGQTRDNLLDGLTHGCKGSFLRIVLTLRTIVSKDNEKAFLQAIEKPPKSLEDAAKRLIAEVNFHEEDTKRIVLWTLTAERPFTINEITDLLRIDVRRKTLLSRETEIAGTIKKLSQSILITTNGTLRFRHSYIRHELLDMSQHDRTLLPSRHVQTELSLRLLAYISICLDASCEPSFDVLDGSTITDLFGSHRLLEYSVRYWSAHFKLSTMHGDKGLEFGDDFKHVFPTTSYLARLEWACWGTMTSTVKVVQWHDLTLRIRQKVFGEKHECVLQSAIIVGSIYRSLERHELSCNFFYRASQIAKSILTISSAVTLTCVSTFLVCAEFITITTRTQFVTYKEEMLKVIIDIYKHQHGKTSDIVIRHYKILAKLYVDLHEHSSATVCYHELYEIICIRYGKHSDEARGISDELMIVLRKDDKCKDILKYTGSIFETSEETMEVWDIRRITITIQIAIAYEREGKISLAEETYIELWQRITEACRTKRVTEMLIAKFDIAFAYVEFLRRCQRVEEASSILICIWEEHQHEAHISETFIIHIKTLGKLMKSFGLLQFAISVFSSVWSFFKKHNKCSHEEALSVTVLISETVEEVITTKTTTVTTTTTTTRTETTTTVSETILIEIFESFLATIHTLKAYTQIIKTCNALVTIYAQLEQWSKAVTILTKTLEIVWKQIIHIEGEISLPGTCRGEAVLIALRYARCYHYQHNFDVAERIYIAIYKACLTGFQIEDEHVQKTFYALIEFYESYHRHDKAIKLYEELLVRYRKHLGASHTLTISLLYKLGSLCLSYGRKEGYSYYVEIVTVLNKDSHRCHHDAFEAAIILSRWYYEEKKWEKCHQICKIVWETYHHEWKTITLEQTLLITLFNRYLDVCRYHVKVEYSILRKLVLEYREVCTQIFGVTASITIEALIQVATILELRAEYYEEALTIYEEIIKTLTTQKTTVTTTTTVTTVTTTSVTTIRERLTKLYVTVIKSSSKCSHTRLQRAITLCGERYAELKIQLGCWHISTLEILLELVLLHKRIHTTESHDIVVLLLRTSFLEIITQVTTTTLLFSAAVKLASIYLACELPTHGMDLVHHLRRIIIVQDVSFESHFGFKCTHAITKRSYIYLVAFEETIRGAKTISYTELMADILIETVLYEKFTSSIKVKAEIETIIVAGARLRYFLSIRKRELQVKTLDDQLLAIFLGKYGSSLTVKDTSKRTLYLRLVVKLGKSKRQLSLTHIACILSDVKVLKWLQKGRFEDAYELANALFQFLQIHNAYHDASRIGYGFKLARHTAFQGLSKVPEKKLHEAFLETSRLVIRAVFAACRDHNISILSLTIEDIDSLVSLLGSQKNYSDLEYLLTQLWNSREIQSKSWKSSTTVLTLGRSLVQARFLLPDSDKKASAINLAEDIAYNLRRAKGSLNPLTLEAYTLLSSLYTAQNRHREAMGIHEEILRLALYGDESDDDGEFDGTDAGGKKLKEVVKAQVKMLKACWERLGGFDKKQNVYEELYNKLEKEFGEMGESPKHWKKDGGVGAVFEVPKAWGVLGKEQAQGKKDGKRVVARRSLTWGVIPAGYGGGGGLDSRRKSGKAF